MKNLLFILSVFILCAGCNSTPKTKDAIEVLDFKKVNKQLTMSEAEKAFFEEPVYVKLGSTDDDALFGSIDAIKVVNNKIFIADEQLKTLVVFDMEGNAIGKVGVHGQGPNEYLNISDFDVDAAGHVYMIDGRLDKLFIYDDRFNFLSSTKLPFEADGIRVLDNGQYMFALSSWNEGEGKGMKVAVTDKDLKVQKSYLPYDEYRDDNFWISGYQLIKANDHIIYNKPIDNTISLFALNGEPDGSLTVDFGDRNTPDEKKKDIEKYLNDFDNYTLLRDFTVVTPYFLAGHVWDGRQTKRFLVDRKTNEIYLTAPVEESGDAYMIGFCGSTMILLINPGMYEEYPGYDTLSDDIKEHLKNGDFVLVLRKMKEGRK